MAATSSKDVVDRAIVSRLVEYAYRIFNTKMVGFFKNNCSAFEQSAKEHKERGDTLEQYEVFKRYEEQLDKHMDQFVQKEGFDDIEQCFNAIDRALKTDKREHDDRMNDLLSQLKELEEETAQLRAAATLKAAGPVDDGDNVDSLLAELDAELDSPKTARAKKSKSDSANPDKVAVHTPQIVLLQPLTLEQMVESVLNMADYSTFSTMMRIRAAHAKQMREMQEAAERRASKTETRKSVLTDDAEHEVFLSSFQELRERICKLTPKREDLQKDAQKEMDGKMLSEIMESGSIGAFRTSVKKLVKFVFKRLMMLCSPNHVATVQGHCDELLTPTALKMPYNKFIRQMLEYGHQDVDRIEKEIQAYMMWVSKMSHR